MGGTTGVEPVLMKICFPSRTSVSPRSDTTCTCVGERKLPMPLKTVTLGLPSSLSKFFLRSMAVRRRFSSMAAA